MAKKTSYSPIYQKMYDAIGNEEIFWEWFWEFLFARFENEEQFSYVEYSSQSPTSRLSSSFPWVYTQSGDEFWSSLYAALLKAKK